MKKHIGLLIVAILIASIAAVAVSGCGETTKGAIESPQGAISYVKSANEITISGKKGKDVWSVEKVTEKELGIPFPPDSEIDEKNSGKLTSGDEEWAAATLWSGESVADVTEWYRAKLSKMDGYKDQSITMDGSEVGMFTIDTGDSLKAVLITTGEGGDPSSSMITIVSRKSS